MVRRKVSRRRTANRLPQFTERLEARALLTTFMVDSFFDTVDVNPGDGVAIDENGQTSLRAAVMEANATPGPDIINLSGGIFSFSLEGTDEDGAATGDLDIQDTLQIFGESPRTTFIDARSLDRVFDVFPGVQLVLFDVTVTGGDLAGRGDGGGVRVNNGMLFVDDSVITDSRASSGGAIYNIGGSVTVDRSTLSDNRAEGDPVFSQGGAITSVSGLVNIRQSTLHNNFAADAGGGVSASGGTVSVENSTIAENSAGSAQESQGDGGGLYIQSSANAAILASTIAFNNAGNHGGGIWNSGSASIGRTIVSNNTSSTGPEGFISGGTVVSDGHNLIREDTNFNFTPATGDLIGTSASPIDPILQPLSDNGGPTNSLSTLTIALGGMSPAIDAGPMDSSPLFSDQRGFARDRDGDRNGSVISDIGAFEVQAPADFFVDDIGTGNIDGFNRAGDFLVTDDATGNGILDFGDTVTFDPDGQPIFGLVFGVRAFGSISDALTAVRIAENDQSEIVLGPGTYSETLTLDIAGLTLRGHTGIRTDVVIDGGGASTGIAVTEPAVFLESLRVTNAVTGVDVNMPSFTSGKPFGATNIQIDGTTVSGLQVFGPFSETSVSIQDSIFTGNTGDGININNVRATELRNVSVTMNGQDGVDVSNSTVVALDTVTVNQSGSRGLAIDNASTIAITDPRTSANTSGNLFSNSQVLLFKGVAGDVANSTTITGSEIQFDAGAGAAQESITLSSIPSVFVTGDGGNDALIVDYSSGEPPAGRQLFLDGGRGRDAIVSSNDAHQRLSDARLTIAGIDEIAIVNFEQGSISGGSGNNNLDATEFEGQVTLSGLAGNDTLRGSASDDVLDGGADDDTLLSGPLVDQYVVGSTQFENLDLKDTDSGVITILDETDTDVATIDLSVNDATFRFNDIVYSGSSLFVSPSGLISFNGPVFPQDNFDLTEAPDAVSSIPIIAPLFDDWITGVTSPPGLTLANAKVLYQFDTANNRLIIEWNDVVHRDQIDFSGTPSLKAGASPATFQLIMELNTTDRDGDIIFNYVDLDTGIGFSSLADGQSATIGGKDGGEHPQGARQVSFNAPSPLVGDSQAIIGRVGLSDGNDSLFGGDGNDTLSTSSGQDFLDGGSGASDRLIYDSFRSPLASDHVVDQFSVTSTIFELPDRSYDFAASYTNVEALDLQFGPADQNVTVFLDGLPAAVSIDTQGPSASDSVTILDAPAGVRRFDGNYSGTYVGSFNSPGGSESIPGVSFPDNAVEAAVNNGAITVSKPDPGTGTVNESGVISFTSPGSILGFGYVVEFTGTFVEVDGDVTGSGNWTILPNGNGITGNGTWSASRVSGGPTGGDKSLTLSGTTVSDGNTTVSLAGVEDLTLDISNGGADDISIDQNFSGSAQRVQIVGDSADDTVSFQSTSKPQLVDIFGEDDYIVQIQEDLGGDLVLEEVLNDGSDDGSGNTINNQQDPDQLVVSPDGSRVYAAAAESASLVVYDRDPVTGDLTFIESLVDGGTDFLGGTISGLDGPSNVIVSADGRHVYVASEIDRTIAFFVLHEGDSQLTFISSTILDDMGNTFNIDLPFGMAFTPDESILMVTSELGDLVAFLEVTSNGSLIAKGVMTDGGLDSGGGTIDGLGGASSLAISPDGQHLYVTGATDNSLAVFTLPDIDEENDNLILPEFIQNLSSGPASGSVLSGASSVVVSPDGRHVYVTGAMGNSVVVLSRNPGSGTLSFVESLIHNNPDQSGTTVQNLLEPISIASSPDGTKIYVAASGSNAVTIFDRDVGTGVLSFDESLISGGTDGAGSSVVGLTEVSSVFASVDGQHVYASGSGDDAIVRFNAPRLLDVSTNGSAAINITTSDQDDQFFLRTEGQPASVSIDTGGETVNDFVTVQGTVNADTINVNGGVLTFNSTTMTIMNSEFLSLMTDTGSDTVNAVASMGLPQLFVDGGAPSLSGDILNVDAQEAQANDSGTQVMFLGGFQSIFHFDIEQVNITNASPTIGGRSFLLAEDAPVTTFVGTAGASDPEVGESLTWRILSGNTGNAFSINPTNGDITVNNPLDFEVTPAYNLVVEVEDSQMLTSQAPVVILLDDVEPAISNQNFNVRETDANAANVGTVVLDPGDTNSIEFSISGGNTGGAFSINSSTGQITVANSSAIVFGGGPFLLNVQVTDDGGTTTDTAIVTINVLEAPAAGVIFDDAVDSGLGTPVGPFATLDNGPGDGSVVISGIDAYGQFQTAVYDPIDSESADTTFDSEVYFRFGDTGPRQTLLLASGESGSSIRSLPNEANSTFSIGDLDFALTQILEPVFDELGAQTGTLLTQTYRITNTGTSTQDFEFVRYLDGDLLFDDSLIDGGGRLQLPTGEDFLFETDAGTTPETATSFLGITGFGGTIPATGRFQIEDFDVLQLAIINGDTLTDNLSNFGAPVDNNGDQFVDAGLEFDIALALTNSFTLNNGSSATYTTHTLFDTDAPADATGNTAPTIAPDSFNVDENSNAGTTVGTVTADDVETPSNLTFDIVGGDPDGFFAINPSTGEITVADSGLDHEALDSFDLTVEVTDPGSLSASATVTIDINDINEAPELEAIGNQIALIDIELAFTAIAKDPDFPPAELIFSLGAGAPVGASISPDGDFSFTASPAQDGMTFPVTIIVTEDNGDALSSSETIMISVVDPVFDYGDAPDTFGTTLINDGPRHVVMGSLFLGNAIDFEDDGIPDAMALGDDNDSVDVEFPIDDEDGITFLSALSIGTTRQFRVFASEAGFLDAWIDFDQSGTFTISENLSSTAVLIPDGGGASSSGFTVETGIAVPAGFSTVSFDIPNFAMAGDTFARFRLSSIGGLSPTGLAIDGEVEDHLTTIVAAPAGNSDSIEEALDTAVDGFFDAFPDELNDPDPTITGDELPLAVQAENGAQAARVNGEVDENITDPALREVIQAINDAVDRLEEDRGADENILVLATHPVDFLLTDPQGRTVGFTQATGTVNEIGPDATFTGDGVVELLTIRNADPGAYSLQLVGVGGVFRGGTSLLTPTGTQRVTFQGSLSQNSDVQLALTYQDGTQNIPFRTDIDQVDFSEIANIVAQIPTAESEARILAAGATEALASIALDRLDATFFSEEDDEKDSLERVLERINRANDRLLDAIETSLDEDDLDSLKQIFGDTPDDEESIEALARILLETVNGPLVSVPRQVDDLSGSLQQLLEQLRQQKDAQQQPQDTSSPDKDDSDSDSGDGTARTDAKDKRTSQRTPDRHSPSFGNSAYIADSGSTRKERRIEPTASSQESRTTDGRKNVRGPNFIARTSPQSSNVEPPSEYSPVSD